MRQRLTLAIEIISLISAVGVVISATTYSLIFHQYGLNYLAIASISDIIRDSIKILILFASVAILIFPLSGLIARGVPRYSKWIIAVGLGLWLTMCIAVLPFGIFVYLSVATPAEFKPISGYAVVAMMIAVFCACAVLYWNLITYPKESRIRGTVPFFSGWILLFTAAVATYGLVASARVISHQIDAGIPIEIHPIDKSLCGGSYSISWIGESRMVVRCAKTKKFVVQFMK